MATIGEQLRAARIAKDLTLEDITEETKIRPFFLQCLEEEKYDRLPDPLCVKNFQRQYAEALGIDEFTAVRAVERRAGSAGPPSPTEEPVTRAAPPGQFLGSAISTLGDELRKNLRAVTTACVAVGLIVAGAFWWYNLEGSVDGDERGTLNQSAVPPAIPSPPTPPAVISSPPHGTVTYQGQSSAVEIPSGQSAEPVQRAEMMEVEIRATDRLWVRYLVDEANDAEMTMRAGERKLIRADSVVQVSVGNAAAVVLLVGGDVHDQIGESGQVRHLRITREGWSFVPPGSF